MYICIYVYIYISLQKLFRVFEKELFRVCVEGVGVRERECVCVCMCVCVERDLLLLSH